jgi:hypothetical protein
MLVMAASDIALLLIFGGWAVASAAFQFDRPFIRRWSYRDCFGLLPLWTFFAPSPGQSDYHLVIRDQHADGSLSPLRELPLTESRKFYSWIWNPEKRTKKVLSDVVQMLVEVSGDPECTPNVILVSTPYTLILNAVMQEPRSEGVTRRQFVIAQTRGFFREGDPQVLLKSGFHRF